MQLPWHHIHITIGERSEAARWYVEAGLGNRGEPTKRSENLWFGDNLVQVQSEDVATPSASQFHSLGMQVTDLAEAAEVLEARGAAIIERGADSVLVRDPFGTGIELIAGKEQPQSHLNIVCADPRANADWYVEALGGESIDCDWDNSRYAVGWNTQRLCFLPSDTPCPDRTIDHMGWFTSDLDATFERLSGIGVDFPVPPRPFGQVRLAFLQDPGGIWIELVERNHPTS